METDLLMGRHVDPSSGREKFGVFAERWLEARDLRPRTRDTYASQLAHILDEFETVELRKITPSAVRAWHGRLSKSNLHPNTVAKVYRLFRTMLDTAVDDGLLRTNPVHIKGAAVELSIERPMLDWDDIERIADAIHPRFRALVWVGATSGLRYGELTGLTRQRVDLDNRSLRVDQALSFVKGQGPTLGPPKSAAAHRTVMIPTGVAEMLAAHIEAYVADDMVSGMLSTLRAVGSDLTTVEVKAAAGGLPKSIVETVSAFSNTNGGLILLGLDESSDFAVLQIDSGKLASDLASACADQLEPPIRPEIEIVEVEGNHLVAAFVDELPQTQKPCFVKSRGIERGSFVRTFDGDRSLSTYEVHVLQSSRGQPDDDGAIVAGATTDDLDPALTAALLARLAQRGVTCSRPQATTRFST